MSTQRFFGCNDRSRKLREQRPLGEGRITNYQTFILSGNTAYLYGSDRRPHVITYCPPCLHLIKATLEFRTHLATARYRTAIRVDFRVPVSCCPRVKLETILRFFHDTVDQHRISNYMNQSTYFGDIDTVWIRDSRSNSRSPRRLE